jgi:hypothetical protein
MKLRILVAAMLAAVLVLIPTAADAKGAKDMTLSGPGLASPIRLDNTGTDAGSSPNTIAEKAGLFAALFGETPDRLSVTGRRATSARGTWPRTSGSSGRTQPHPFVRMSIPSPTGVP